MNGKVSPVAAALSDWLQSFSWTWFVTVTFANPARYPRQALSRLQGLDRLWTPCDECSRGYTLRKGIRTSCVLVQREYRAFLAAEPHSTGDYHVHGLLHHECANSSDSLTLQRAIGRRFGISRVDNPRAIGGVAGYTAKYITKQTADWDMYGDWRS